MRLNFNRFSRLLDVVLPAQVLHPLTIDLQENGGSALLTASTPESRAEGQGKLMVYSALESVNLGDSNHPAHSSYTIYDRDGKILQHVNNRSGSFYRSLVAVSLPTGTYKVKGRATNNGWVMVSVVIEDGRTTILDLDGSTLPQRKPQRGDHWVRLPDGQVIGAKVN